MCILLFLAYCALDVNTDEESSKELLYEISSIQLSIFFYKQFLCRYP